VVARGISAAPSGSRRSQATLRSRSTSTGFCKYSLAPLASAFSRSPGGVNHGDLEREGTALTRLAFGDGPAAEQGGQFAADGQAQTCATVLVAGGAVGLLERLEDRGEFVATDRGCR